MKKNNLGLTYGYTVDGHKIAPKKGERILKEGEEIPEVHREYISGHGWLQLRTFVHKHAGANRTAQVFGNYIAYAAPIEQVKELPSVTDHVKTLNEDSTDLSNLFE